MSEISAHHGIFGDTLLHLDDTGGSGRPVVLIHGWPLSGASWNLQVPALSEAGYRVITYDRRGFGRSDKPLTGYTYDTFAEDLQSLLTKLDVSDVTLVGFSMGGGEVARYLSTYGAERIHSAVFASAVPPYLLKTPGNPDGPLPASQAAKMTAALTASKDGFFKDFVTDFYSVDGNFVVTEAQKQEFLDLADQSSKEAALLAMAAFANTDFRDDLAKIDVPTLVIHGDSDAVVPFEGSGKRTHEAVAGSELQLIAGGPHGVITSHPQEWNSAVIGFRRNRLRRCGG